MLGTQFRRFRIWSWFYILCGIVACSGGRAHEPLENLPSWVMSPPQGLCGLGSATVQGSNSLARTAATARGRANLASQVELHVNNLLASFESDQEEIWTKQISAQRVSQQLIGSRAFKEYLGQKELFVLVCIQAEKVQEALEREVQTREVSLKQKTQLRQRSDEAFKELEAHIKEVFLEP